MTLIASPGGPKLRDPIEIARAWLDESGSAALATVVATWGSSPVPVGGQLVVAPDGRFEGSVSGGCVEADVITEAADVLANDKAKLLEFGVADEMAWRAGLPCGGAIAVYLEPLRKERDGAYLDKLLSARRSRLACRRSQAPAPASRQTETTHPPQARSMQPSNQALGPAWYLAFQSAYGIP